MSQNLMIISQQLLYKIQQKFMARKINHDAIFLKI